MRGVTLSHARLHGAILTIICGMGAFLTSGTEEQSNTCTTRELTTPTIYYHSLVCFFVMFCLLVLFVCLFVFIVCLPDVFCLFVCFPDVFCLFVHIDLIEVNLRMMFVCLFVFLLVCFLPFPSSLVSDG